MMVSLLFSRRYWPVSKGYDRVDSEMVLSSTYREAFRLICNLNSGNSVLEDQYMSL
jgi:hypothetical protein